MHRETVVNHLDRGHASGGLRTIWSPLATIRLEREVWLQILKAQAAHGVHVDYDAILDYERVVDVIDLDSIRVREARLKHDIAARIEEFCILSGREHIHKGLTSADLRETVEQIQIQRALHVLISQLDFISTCIVPGGKCNPEMQAFAINSASRQIVALKAELPWRGLKGAVGTYLDQIRLFSGDVSIVKSVENAVAEHFGFCSILRCTGQVYPRSLDLHLVNGLLTLICDLLRVSSGVASSSSTRGLLMQELQDYYRLMSAYLVMVAEVSGDQWNEGDISGSVVRRVVLPNIFLVASAAINTYSKLISSAMSL